MGFPVSLLWESWLGPGYFRRTRYASGPGNDYAPAPWRRRGYVVEEEDVPAGPPPPP